ncbi:MAG: M20 family metallopeptidase [Tissierellia bacterium]|jgi:amidohydrolase|nr:M20 family metallopeptidase [Tissierellia bacterium]
MLDKIFNEVDNIKGELLQLSKDIHENPELSFGEYKSSGFIKELLRKHDFEIEDNSGGMETAFKARYKGKKAGPRVAFLAEYDALPEIGHACGHNLIAMVSAGAAIALSKFMDEIPGEIVLMGTPAEEGGGGKVLLIESGDFGDIDYSLMTHPSTENLVHRGGLAISSVGLKFYGVSAHSAAPEFGINALQAVIQTFNNIDTMRGLFPTGTNINGIIIKGGTASNIIPDYAESHFTIRARTLGDLKIVVKHFKNIVESVEKLTGARGELDIGKPYAERYPNLIMGEAFKRHMEAQGEEVNYPDPNKKVGSSDIGNVSLLMPAIHEYFKITDENINSHAIEFTEAAISEYAQEMGIKAAKSLASVGYEILTDEEFRNEIDEEFKNTVPKYGSFDL